MLFFFIFLSIELCYSRLDVYQKSEPLNTGCEEMFQFGFNTDSEESLFFFLFWSKHKGE